MAASALLEELPIAKSIAQHLTARELLDSLLFGRTPAWRKTALEELAARHWYSRQRVSLLSLIASGVSDVSSNLLDPEKAPAAAAERAKGPEDAASLRINVLLVRLVVAGGEEGRRELGAACAAALTGELPDFTRLARLTSASKSHGMRALPPNLAQSEAFGAFNDLAQLRLANETAAASTPEKALDLLPPTARSAFNAFLVQAHDFCLRKRDIRRFKEAREERKARAIGAKTDATREGASLTHWSPAPCIDDFFVGKLASASPASHALASVQQSTWGLLTTFPVGAATIEGRLHPFNEANKTRLDSFRLKQLWQAARVGDDFAALDTATLNNLERQNKRKPIRPASTAIKVKAIQQLFRDSADQMIWVDSNPFARSANDKTRKSDKLQQKLYKLTADMLDESLKLPVLVLASSANRAWTIDHVLPTYARTSVPLDPEALPLWLALHARDPARRHFGWDDKDSSSAWRRATTLELALYSHMYLHDVSSVLPHRPKATFVRHYRGSNCSKLLIFAPHPCMLDADNYGIRSFDLAAHWSYRAFATVEALMTGRALEPVEARVRTPLHDALFPPGSVAALVHRKDGKKNILGTLFGLREHEITYGQVLSWERFTPQQKGFIVTHLDMGTKPESYIPREIKKQPSSILADLLSSVGATRLEKLADLETKREDGKASKHELNLLEHHYASSDWREKLFKLGVLEDDFYNKKAFRIGLELRKDDASPYRSPQFLSIMSMASYRTDLENGDLFWTAHPFPDDRYKDDEDRQLSPLGVARGFITTIVGEDGARKKQVIAGTWVIEDGEAKKQKVSFTPNKMNDEFGPCAECRKAGLPACLLTFDMAIRLGIVQAYVPVDLIRLGLQARLDALVDKKNLSQRINPAVRARWTEKLETLLVLLEFENERASPSPADASPPPEAPSPSNASSPSVVPPLDASPPASLSPSNYSLQGLQDNSVHPGIGLPQPPDSESDDGCLY